MIKERIIKTGFVLILCSIGFFSCSKDENPEPIQPFTWKQAGLSGLKVNRLELIDNDLYAITNDGLYSKDVNTENDFALLGLKGKNLLDIVVFDKDHLLASHRNSVNWEDTELYETTDGGLNWSVKEHNFGKKEYTESVLDFFWDATTNILYATSYGALTKSSDKGTTWEVVWGDWGNLGTGMMIEINPEHQNDIWFGGQGGIENGYLINMQDETVINSWYNLVPNPTVPKEIVFDKHSPQNIYVGWEGELNKSSNSGDTWETLIDRHEEAHFFFGIGLSNNNPDLIFAGKWIKGSDQQPLTLYYSQDGGYTWDENNYSDEEHGGIFDLKVITANGKERIFLALDKGGVYEVVVDINKI